MKRLSVLAITLIVAALALSALIAQQALAEPAKQGYYFYSFDVDPDGQVSVRILFHAKGSGTSWLLVPKRETFLVNWTCTELRGRLTFKRLSEVKPEPHYFYLNLSFGYAPDKEGIFELEVGYDTSYGALIVEPEGFFYSTQIGFDGRFEGRAKVLLPSGALREGLAFLGRGRVSVERGRVALYFDKMPSFDRLAVEFKVSGSPQMVTVSKGLFEAEVPKRYVSLAEYILNLYDEAYPILSSVYGVSLEKVRLRFFPPNLELLKTGMGGYVPFVGGEEPGAVYLNLFYVRAIGGFMEVIAIHELAHHFTWALGFKPTKLWVHEGLSEYFGINVARRLGYREGVEEHLKRLRAAEEAIGGNYGFIQLWKPTGQVSGLNAYYAASYSVFKALGEKYGGFSFYRKFFKLVKEGGGVDDDSVIVDYLSKAAGENLFPTFRKWGFQVAKPGEEEHRAILVKMMIEEVEMKAGEITDAFLQPARAMAEGLATVAATLLRLRLFEQAKWSVTLSDRLLSTPRLASVAYYLSMLTLIAIAAALYLRARESLRKI